MQMYQYTLALIFDTLLIRFKNIGKCLLQDNGFEIEYKLIIISYILERMIFVIQLVILDFNSVLSYLETLKAFSIHSKLY